jgi:catechol 2,3-dioxygenase-like lactoylglutathione lyase family enzyme
LKRRGGEPTDISSAFRLSDEVCAGVKTFIVSENALPREKNIGLDHLVINTPNPDRAIAHYGARLGIRFALDRKNTDWGARFLFFKLGDIVLEIIHRMDQEHDLLAPDELWGLTWKVDNIAVHHARLSQQNVTLSEIRTGRKPGTQVFTVKSHTDNIPTLFLMGKG